MDDHTLDTIGLMISKAGAILASSLLHLVFGLIPLKVIISLRNAYYSYENASMADDHKKRWSLIVCVLTCFAGGVFLGTCMLSMLPELQAHFRCVQHLATVRNFYQELIFYPWPQFVAFMGFFIVFFVEEVTLFVLKQRKDCIKRRSSVSEKSQENEFDIMFRLQAEDKNKRRRSGTVSQRGVLLEPPFQPHPHSHVVRSLVILLTLSFHTIIESMSYASRRNMLAVWNLFWTTNTHQVVVAFALGTQLARTHRRNVVFVMACVCLFSLSTPIGFLSGLGFEAAGQHMMVEELTVMILEGLSVGAFLYVTFYEVLSHELNNEHPAFLKLATIFLGCLCVAALTLFPQGAKGCGIEVH